MDAIEPMKTMRATCMANAAEEPRLTLRGKRVVLLLQGGGALGAYQVGAFAALGAACRQESARVAWVGGISIGAINAAAIAAPAGGDAVAALDSVWNDILSPAFPPFDVSRAWEQLPPLLRSGWLAPLAPKDANWMFAAFNPWGQPSFFGSRVLDPLRNPWFAQWLRPLPPDELAFYTTDPLRSTLDKHIDWKALERDDATRLSLGATRVRDGEVVFFNSFAAKNPDWRRQTLRADHVLASGALPPTFPAVAIHGEWYWDGGVSSNTPIAELAEELTADAALDTIVFLVDLWDRKGLIPQSFDDALWRQKSIAYGSRKDAAVNVVNTHELEVEAKRTAPSRLEVCQVMLERPPGDTQPQFSFSDADFSRATFERLRGLGAADMLAAIDRPYRVPGVGGAYAALYRHGTFGKHRATDGRYALRRERAQRPSRAATNGEKVIGG